MTQIYFAINILLRLLQRNLYIFWQHFFFKLRLALIFCVVALIIAQLFMAQMGVSNFGAITLVSLSLINGFFTVMMNAILLVADIQGNKTISYELTLPIRPTLIFIKYALSSALEAFLISCLLLPVGKLLFFTTIHFTHFSLIKLSIIYFCSSLFFGFFSLLLASTIKNLYKAENIWIRIIFPMWFLGCYQFSWKTLYAVSPLFAYINLLNPLTHITEAGRSATLDVTGSLPFWSSCMYLLFCTALVGYIGIRLLKKRLDCI